LLLIDYPVEEPQRLRIPPARDQILPLLFPSVPLPKPPRIVPSLHSLFSRKRTTDLPPQSVPRLSAILLEVVDSPDPVEVGAETVYTITVTNQGSTPGTNIVVSCNLEEQAEYAGSRGTTRAVVAGKSITFAPVASLAPKAKAQWQMRVKAIGTGDIRFHVRMNSDQLTRDVQETEATHFYQ
jgi:hypothetical protein